MERNWRWIIFAAKALLLTTGVAKAATEVVRQIEIHYAEPLLMGAIQVSGDRLFLLSPAGKEISSYDLTGNHLFDVYFGDRIDRGIADYTVLPSGEIVVASEPDPSSLLIVSTDGKSISQHPLQKGLTVIRVAGNQRGGIYALGFRSDLIGPRDSLTGPLPLVFKLDRTGGIVKEECWLEPMTFENWRKIRDLLYTTPFVVDERENKYFQQSDRQLTVVDESGAARLQELPDAGFDIQILANILTSRNTIDLFFIEGDNVASRKEREADPRFFTLKNPLKRLINYLPEHGSFEPVYEEQGRLCVIARRDDGTLLSAYHRNGKVFVETISLPGAAGK